MDSMKAFISFVLNKERNYGDQRYETMFEFFPLAKILSSKNSHNLSKKRKKWKYKKEEKSFIKYFFFSSILPYFLCVEENFLCFKDLKKGKKREIYIIYKKEPTISWFKNIHFILFYRKRANADIKMLKKKGE